MSCYMYGKVVYDYLKFGFKTGLTMSSMNERRKEGRNVPLRSTGSLLKSPPAVIATKGPKIPNVLRIPGLLEKKLYRNENKSHSNLESTGWYI